MRRKMTILALAAGALCTFVSLRLQAQVPAKHEPMAAGGITKAIAVLHATKIGGEASGIVTFTKVQGGVHVEAEIRGLTPGLHGFHIHEFGDCSSPDAMSAGGHFNPAKAEHGAPTAGKRHVGDLGNIEASARGVAKLDVVDPLLGFSGPSSIIGRGLIVHEKPDDLKTQPTGNAGGRVACAVIGVAKGS
jgi:Cu-Zn family superoxide dismutase